jgi:hypothetical protein
MWMLYCQLPSNQINIDCTLHTQIQQANSNTKQMIACYALSRSEQCEQSQAVHSTQKYKQTEANMYGNPSQT